jgi:hypothetical protein
MRLILVVVMATGLVCGCTTRKPAVPRPPAVQAGQPQIAASRETVAKAEAAWQVDPKNPTKRQAYDDAVAACMAAIGRVK